jgi:hypothetical protein
MDDNAKELIARGDKRFADRAPLDSLRNEIALNFAPQLAGWMGPVQLGSDYASHLVDGTPLLVARDFLAQIGSMLRPAGKQWFWHRTSLEDMNNQRDVRDYLDWRSVQQLRIMSNWTTGFHAATKMGDDFFGLFGDACISVDANVSRTDLEFKAYHTKDVAWAIGRNNRPDALSRRECVPARVVKARFSQPDDKLHEKMLEACEKNPEHEINIRHEVLPSDEYEAYRKKKGGRVDGWSSVWIDVDNKHVIREGWQKTFKYVTPRWGGIGAYGLSPATMIALPDARLLQQQALTLLEVAERVARPPLIATRDAVRGAVDQRADGITWVDSKYDERTGEALRPLNIGAAPALAIDSLLRTQQQLNKAFYLDILRMPDTRNSKSTVEVQFLIDEYIRAALPLFAPMQSEYSQALLQEADAQIEILGGYNERAVPPQLKRDMLQFQWDNPLTEMLDRKKSQTLSEISTVGQTVAGIEAAAQQVPALQRFDGEKAFLEVSTSLGGAKWLRSDGEVKKLNAEQAKTNKMRELVAAAPNIAQVISAGSDAAATAAAIPQMSEPGMPLLPAPE